MDVLLDASAIMAVLMEEPEKDLVLNLTRGSTLVAPNVIDFEIGNALSKLYKRKIITKDNAFEIFSTYKGIPINKAAVDIEKSIKIFCDYSIYAYDAYYLETAIRFRLPLISFDGNMRSVAKNLGITILGGII